MSEERYPDVIELKLKLCFSDAHKTIRKMKNSIKKVQHQKDVKAAKTETLGRKVIKMIEIPVEALERLKAGKYVDGSLCVDKLTNRLTFRDFHRKPRVRKKDKVICYHPHGWMKMSENNLKFFASVPKRVGAVCACQAMDNDLQYATGELLLGIEEGDIDSNDIKLY